MNERVSKTAGKRRRHDPALKRDLVERSLQPGASVAALAQEHGLNANLLFNWRRLHLRGMHEGPPPAPEVVLLPVTVEDPGEIPAPKPVVPPARPSAGVIEIDLGGARVRLRGAVDETSVRCVLQALAALA
jgi:transposase